jgi:acyl-CoA thioester hydrolase
MDTKVFTHSHRVTYAECTVGNHVYYGRYLDLLEEARGEFFRHLGTTFLQWQEQDTLFPVVECQLRYKGAAHYDDALTIEVWLTEMARVRLRFAYRIVNQTGQPLLEAETLHACTTITDKLKRLPAELTERLLPYLAPAGPEPGSP